MIVAAQEARKRECQSFSVGQDRTKNHWGQMTKVSLRHDPRVEPWNVCENHIKGYEEAISMIDDGPTYLIHVGSALPLLLSDNLEASCALVK